ncbi:GNAT family N-acetyltransferase [Pseudaminobacter sp. 19-2017]|uniref:GNAT family N-acetyltransferase n=1 Tax=Pseudaminobacter soli (ex Zhang et al. 2022) TaxID=2831468 RepID=A0A942DWX0_9HYPH|nr:GNAT family N-acetyltransferase [Pseudaminobacter soli]MBS3648337.1 GNAT family N-acetyltransferase [Pseudaminobacter soli]
MQKIELRLATADDVDTLTDVFLRARRMAMPYLPSLYTAAEVTYWLTHIVLPGSRLIVAHMADAGPMGFSAVRSGQLDHLYVQPCSQGCGVGTSLLADAMKNSPEGLRLYVFQRNTRAREFYQKNGFRLVELRQGSENEENEPDAVYEWRP